MAIQSLGDIIYAITKKVQLTTEPVILTHMYLTIEVSPSPPKKNYK